MGAFFSQKLGRYTILRELEKGGMASVDLALRDDADELCVIKRLHHQDVSKKNNVRRFHREAKLASMLAHPNLARVIDAGLEEDVFCLVSEFVPGKTLASFRGALIRRDELLPFDLTAHLAMEVLSALEYVHGAMDEHGQPLNMVHRDLSARNVMISFAGDVKVIDFGLAKADIDDFQTAQGTLLGTFPYLSPEQAIGEAVDGRSDLYSLSVILFETLSGRALIARTQPTEMLRKILESPPPPHSAFPADVPAALRTAVLRGLAKRPEERWQSARAYREAILHATGPIDQPATRLSETLQALYPEEARQMAQVIAFYERGGDVLATARASSGFDLPAEEPLPTLVTTGPATLSALPPSSSTAASPSQTLPEVELPARRVRRVTAALALVLVGWALGWLLSPHVT